MSVPGMIDSRQGSCINGGNLTYVELLPLAANMKERVVFRCIMNDAKAAALEKSPGELWLTVRMQS